MNEDDYSSDTSDEDYVPTEPVDVSEEENSGDEEDFKVDDIDNLEQKKHKKRIATSGSTSSKAGINAESEVTTEVGKEGEKAKSDKLWAEFMKDVPSHRPSSTANKASSVPDSTAQCKTEDNVCNRESDKVFVVKEYNFAGETVKVTEAVDVNSKKTASSQVSSASSKDTQPISLSASGPTIGSVDGTTTASTSATASILSVGVKRPGGLSSVLNKIDKKPKMSTLVKSKLDWETFKSQEGIDEDLKIHNRGKSGYLERKAFLERTDLRQFEMEKNLRLGSQRKST